ncbi:hypothetical protein A6R68_08785, partial [Neotoma lepida]
MKLHISLPAASYQTFVEVDGGCRFCTFYENHIATDWDPKELSEYENFSISLKKMMSTKAPKIWCLVTPHDLQHKCQPIVCSEEKCTKKNKEEAAEYAKHLAKTMKDAEEKCQEQIAMIHRECF